MIASRPKIPRRRLSDHHRWILAASVGSVAAIMRTRDQLFAGGHPPSPESPLWPIKGISFIANSPPTTPFLIQYSWILENLEVRPAGWSYLMQEIWGRRIVWGGTHRPPNQPPPNTSTTLETPSSSLVMDDQTVYWLIGLFPWLMVRIRMRRPSMPQPNSTLTEECESI